MSPTGWKRSPATGPTAAATRRGRQTLPSGEPPAQRPERSRLPHQAALAWQLIAEARAAGLSFRLVVADSVYGENAELEAQLFAAKIPYVIGLRPSHRVWRFVEDPVHPAAFTPAEAALRLPRDAWQRTTGYDSHGKELVRLIAATLDPARLKLESTWYLVLSPVRD